MDVINLFVDYSGEYQALQASGLYGLEKNLENQQRHTSGQNNQLPHLKAFGQNISCVPRFLASGIRHGNHSDDSFQMQRVAEGNPQASYTYGRYVGLKPNQQVLASNTIDPRLFDQQQQSRQGAHRLYVRDFPRSKSSNTVVPPPGNKSEGSGESSEGGAFKSAEECGEESMLLLLPEGEDRSETSEQLSSNKEHGEETFPSPDGQQQMNAGSNKLIASAYREASFV